MANSIGKPGKQGKKLTVGSAKANPMFTGKASKPGKTAGQLGKGFGVVKNKGGKVDSGDATTKKGKKGGRNQS